MSFDLRLSIVGSGTIGLSFAALHLSHPSKQVQVTIYDPRPDLKEYIETTLPGVLLQPKEYQTMLIALQDI